LTTTSAQQQFITNEQFSYYSVISNPSFKAYEKLPDWQKAKLIENFVREVMLSNLSDRQAQIVLNDYFIIDYTLSVKEFDLTDTANSHGRDILAYAVVSMGSKQNFLKTLLTNYSITEQKSEEKAYQEFKEQKKDDEKKKWSFFGK